MICPSCEKELHPPQFCESRFTSTYHCAPCRAEFNVWEGIKHGDEAYQWRQYRIYCDYQSGHSMVQRIYMDIETDTSITYRWYTVLELPAIPKNLSAETIERKIKTILLFS
jgi:hypothetical protein